MMIVLKVLIVSLKHKKKNSKKLSCPIIRANSAIMKFVTFRSMVYYETGIGFGKMIQLAKYITY